MWTVKWTTAAGHVQEGVTWTKRQHQMRQDALPVRALV